MKSGWLALAAIVAASWFASSAKTDAPGLTIYVRNTSTLVSDAQIANALPAFQQALTNDFAPVWHVNATLVQIPEGQSAPVGWQITVEDNSDQPGAAGYHQIGPGDNPAGFVFASAGDWQLTFTHELWEMLVDPHIDRVSTPTLGIGTKFYAFEVADPVEDGQYAFYLPGADGTPVEISDFVTERWFDGQGGGPMDFMQHCRHAHKLLTNGYIAVYDGSWHDIFANPSHKVTM